MDTDLDNLFDDAVDSGEQLGENGAANVINQPEDLEDIPLAAVKKKRILRPQPKLDTRKLMGPRGIPALQKEFENVAFQGPGREVEDLDLLMSHIEHWAHRLHPKMTFDDCLEKIERLGHKKEIQVCMRKLRMGMPLIDTEGGSTVITEDVPSHEGDINEERDVDEEIFNLPMNEDF